MGNSMSPAESNAEKGNGVFAFCKSCKRALPVIKDTFESPHFFTDSPYRRYEFQAVRDAQTVVYMRSFDNREYKCKPCYLGWNRAKGTVHNNTEFKLSKLQESNFGIAQHMFLTTQSFPEEILPNTTVSFDFAVKPAETHPAWAVVYNVNEAADTRQQICKAVFGGEVFVENGVATHGFIACPANALPDLSEVKSMSDNMYRNDAHPMVATMSVHDGNLDFSYTLSLKNE